MPFSKNRNKICTFAHVKKIIMTLAKIKDKFRNRYKIFGKKIGIPSDPTGLQSRSDLITLWI
jgi:hypothetical protein